MSLIKLKKKNIFSKWLHHKFGHKFEISSGTVFLWLTLKYDVWWSTKSKRTLSGLKNDIVTESKKIAFAQRGKPMILVKKVKFFLPKKA